MGSRAVERGNKLLNAYRAIDDVDQLEESSIIDALADILEWADHAGHDWHRLVAYASMHVEAETSGPVA